jgi:hypothetical protein
MLSFTSTQLKEMVLALLHESDLLLFDEAVEQIVDQVQCKCYFQLNSYRLLFGPPVYHCTTEVTTTHLLALGMQVVTNA